MLVNVISMFCNSLYMLLLLLIWILYLFSGSYFFQLFEILAQMVKLVLEVELDYISLDSLKICLVAKKS